MPMLTDTEVEGLRITHFIFRVVHHGRLEPVRLEAAPLGPIVCFGVQV
jgi:hypothetical protein